MHKYISLKRWILLFIWLVFIHIFYWYEEKLIIALWFISYLIWLVYMTFKIASRYTVNFGCKRARAIYAKTLNLDQTFLYKLVYTIWYKNVFFKPNIRLSLFEFIIETSAIYISVSILLVIHIVLIEINKKLKNIPGGHLFLVLHTLIISSDFCQLISTDRTYINLYRSVV